MAKSKGSKAKDQRRRERRAAGRQQRRGTESAAVEGSWASPMTQTSKPEELPMEYKLDGPPGSGLAIAPGGRLARILGNTLHVLTEHEREELPANTEIAGADYAESFAVVNRPTPPENFYVIQPPAFRDGVPSMQVGAIGLSDTEVGWYIWHPTYTATLQWEPDAFDEGGWMLVVMQDAGSTTPVAEIFIEDEQPDLEDWEGGEDATSVDASLYIAQHIPALLALGRAQAPEA